MTTRRWNPDTGQAFTFSANETPPANFLPCHPNDPDRAAKVAAFGGPVAKPEQAPADRDMAGGMTRAQIVEALKAGGVEFEPSANKAALCEQLITALKKALTAAEVEFREDETAAELLAKVTKSQE